MQSGIPKRLRALLDQSKAAGPILEFVESCDRILVDNEMPFFPAYTDHGTSHVGSVLEAAERLIPDSVWKEELLAPEDAVVLTGASFLHDLALHLREPGFLSLIAEKSRYRPLPWFDEDQRGRPADAPWHQLWQDFRREARRFSQSQLDRLLGPEHGNPPQIVFGDHDTEPSSWTLNDRLLVGEFLRRHHARLAHEIAVYGFPGIDEAEFPLLGKSLSSLAEAIGATARSHNEDMRVISDYLESRGNGDLRPDGVAQLYLMGVLRIADYFQLESERATPLLLHLREPQSPASVEEWKKHQAITAISWDHKDPHAVNIQVSPAHNLRTHLQLAELVADLQRELDLTGAVLSETYASKLSSFQLSLRRVRTNLHEPDLHRRLSFVPRRARLRSAEDLFRLVVNDLYGNEPAVAGRELLQNAVDAVRERAKWEAVNGIEIADSELHDLPADILVEVAETGEDAGVLRVVDRGIGMTPSTVIDIFLTAGASFGNPRSNEAVLDAATAIKWMKAGRFGVGVFAAFLLGSEIHVTTRHASEEHGVSFRATLDDDLVQLDWVKSAPIGTEILVPYAVDALPDTGPYLYARRQASARKKIAGRTRLLLEQIASYYELVRPGVRYRLATHHGDTYEIPATKEVPAPGSRLPDAWRSVRVPGFDAVLWKVAASVDGGLRYSRRHKGHVTHNGIGIGKPQKPGQDAYEWSPSRTQPVAPPRIAVFDSRQSLGISLNRYELTEAAVPFENELLRSIGLDVVACALACGEHRHPLGAGWGLAPVMGREGWVPLLPHLVQQFGSKDLCVLWLDSHHQIHVGRQIHTQFVAPKGSFESWRQLPLRTALSPLPGIADSREETERATLGIVLPEVDYSMRQLAGLLQRAPVAGSFVQNAGRPRLPSSSRRSLWKKLDLESDAATGLQFAASEEDAGLAATLAAVGARIVAGIPRPRAVALTVFRQYEQLDDPDEHLSQPWIQKLGGPLERSAKKRLARKEELSEQDSELRSLIRKWERLSATS